MPVRPGLCEVGPASVGGPAGGKLAPGAQEGHGRREKSRFRAIPASRDPAAPSVTSERVPSLLGAPLFTLPRLRRPSHRQRPRAGGSKRRTSRRRVAGAGGSPCRLRIGKIADVTSIRSRWAQPRRRYVQRIEERHQLSLIAVFIRIRLFATSTRAVHLGEDLAVSRQSVQGTIPFRGIRSSAGFRCR